MWPATIFADPTQTSPTNLSPLAVLGAFVTNHSSAVTAVVLRGVRSQNRVAASAMPIVCRPKRALAFLSGGNERIAPQGLSHHWRGDMGLHIWHVRTLGSGSVSQPRSNSCCSPLPAIELNFRCMSFCLISTLNTSQTTSLRT